MGHNMMDEFDKAAWQQFVSQPYDPSFDWRKEAERLRSEAMRKKRPS